jgi:formylmethanofuran dehydrogenase subunit E
MGKFIFGLLIAAIIWLLFFMKRKQRLSDKNTVEPAASQQSNAALEQIVTCSRCGVNIPQSEAILQANGKFLCANTAECSAR